MIWRTKSLIRTRAALVVGTVIATTIAGVLIVLGRGRTSEAWVVPLIVLLLALIAQLMLDGREALQRERRLVRTAAALREATAQLEKLAATDPLTGIWNRRAFFEAFGVEFRRAQRYNRDLSVLMIDLDNFKQANDLGGHAFGDYVLSATAKLIHDSLRESDMAGRYGGEEFAVVLPETDGDHTAPVAEKLRAAIEAFEFRTNRYPLPGEPAKHFTVSIGAASLPLPKPGESEALMAQADEALFEAKRSGKNRVHRFGLGMSSAGAPIAQVSR
ncbi:MAG: GGDEF domain-containing protein [Chloroflexi bacterium]|nr:MAG: GGDEF domain-containing protein [Chloroflexota bacterium]